MPGFTDEQAAQIAEDFATNWSKTNTVRLDRRKLRQRQLDPPLPPGWSQNIHIKHHTYEIDDAVRVLRNRLLGAPVSVLVFAKGGGAVAQKRASDIRRFLDKVWIDFNSGYPSARFTGTDGQVGDGVWAAHVAWDQDWIDGALEADDLENYLRTEGLPFTLETPDPLNVMAEFDKKGKPQMVVTIEEVPISELINRRYENADGDELSVGVEGSRIFRSSEPLSFDNLYSGDFRERVKVATLEDANFVHRVVLSGDSTSESFGLGKWPNLFKRPAWVFMPGDFSNSTDPLERWKPMVLGMLSMGQEVNMMRSARLNSGVLAGLYRLLMERKEGTGFGPIGKEENPRLKFQEDGMVTAPDGWNVRPFEFPVAADALLQNALISVEMELARFKPSPALRGQREEGVSTGYQQALIAEAAMTDLEPALEVESQGIRDIFTLVLDGAKAIAEETDGKIDTLYVGTLKEYSEDGEPKRSEEVLALKTAEIDDYEITVRMSSMSATSRIALLEEGRRARQAGEIDDIEFYEHYGGYEDGVEMQRRATEQRMYDAMLPEAIAVAQQIVREQVMRRTGMAGMGVGPGGWTPQGAGQPPQAGGVPGGSAAPGLDATLVQPVPPTPQARPLEPANPQTGGGSMT